MVIKPALAFIAGVWTGMIVQAAPVVIDLSRSHTVDDVMKSGLVMREIAGGRGERDYVFENQDVEIRLPGARSIVQRVSLGIIDTEDNMLRKLSMTGGVMPEDQAFLVADAFVRSFNLSITNLLHWKDRRKFNEPRSRAFGATSGWNYYPRIGLAISSSVGQLYPWVIRCGLEWGRSEQRDWSEDRVWRELSPPAMSDISLNPPSGLIYDIKDAYKASLEAQARYDKELATRSPMVGPPALSPPIEGEALPKPSRPSQSGSATFSPWTWIIGAILLLVAVCGLTFAFRRK